MACLSPIVTSDLTIPEPTMRIDVDFCPAPLGTSGAKSRV